MLATFLRHFRGSLLFSLVCLGLAAAYGWHETGSAAATGAMLWVVLVLAVLEVSLSFDCVITSSGSFVRAKS